MGLQRLGRGLAGGFAGLGDPRLWLMVPLWIAFVCVVGSKLAVRMRGAGAAICAGDLGSFDQLAAFDFLVVTATTAAAGAVFDLAASRPRLRRKRPAAQWPKNSARALFELPLQPSF